MPRSPVHVTPGVYDDPSSLVTEPEAETSTMESIAPIGSWYYSRSQTTAGDPLCSPSILSNEFQHVLGRRGASLDLHETRPSLKRAISTNRKTFEGERAVDINGRKETTQKESEVIVHQIQPGDSLPGVALKYNVSLATLRSANKLWANDTIHLRQVLYIPIQAIARNKAKLLPDSWRVRAEHPSHSLHSTPEVHIRTLPRIHKSSSDWNAKVHSETTTTHGSATHTISVGSTSIIKRVPLSELSFFPPSTSALSSPKHTPLRTRPESPLSLFKSENPSMPSSSFSNSIRGSQTFAIANLWHGAKDEIISRLSFESTRGSSDASEEQDLELVVVQPRGNVRRRNSSTDEDQDQELIPQPNGTAIAMRPMTEHDGDILNTPRKPKVIRTIQLQPSPKMVIPASS